MRQITARRYKTTAPLPQLKTAKNCSKLNVGLFQFKTKLEIQHHAYSKPNLHKSFQTKINYIINSVKSFNKGKIYNVPNYNLYRAILLTTLPYLTNTIFRCPTMWLSKACTGPPNSGNALLTALQWMHHPQTALKLSASRPRVTHMVNSAHE